jgi:lipoyl-dependent peroxiredoxin
VTGYSACFSSALKAVAQKQNIVLPNDPIVDAEVRLGTLPSGYGISASLEITLPELDPVQAQALVDQAHLVCPYSVATRGNIEVTLTLKA